jgi:hypothetical protein
MDAEMVRTYEARSKRCRETGDDISAGYWWDRAQELADQLERARIRSDKFQADILARLDGCEHESRRPNVKASAIFHPATAETCDGCGCVFVNRNA